MSKKNKVIILSITVLLICTIIVGITYAYWKLTYQATSVNKIVSSCFSMELTNEKNNITLDSAYPISDEKGKSLTPYSFTITNTCDLFASYTINLEMLEGTTLDSKYIKSMINSEATANLGNLPTADVTIDGALESRVLYTGSLGSGDTVDYTFRLWMDYDTPLIEEAMNKTLQAKITVTGEVSTYSPVENGFDNLAEALLVNEYQTTDLSIAKDRVASKQTVDTTKTAPIIDWQPLTATTTVDLAVIKADSSVVGTYNISANAAKILLGKSYSFNSETGYYALTERAYYDPSTLDYSSADYYICGSNITVTANNSLTYWDGTSCSTIYKISSLSSTTDSTTTLSGGDNIATKKYTFKVYKMYETELESDKSDKGIYQGTDDDGTTYFYRGNVTNNYVKFANLYWRIIRINGDGSVRLLYAGTTSTAEDSALGIGTSQFNSVRTNPTYVGYMYSNTLNTSYVDTITNDNNSTIKTKLDTWYKTNIVDTGYSGYVADSGFCNDRSIASDSPGTGATASETTYYSPRYRIINHVPTFSCTNTSNDLFTITGNTKGNGELTYPVGLITIDELAFAGASYGYLNKMSYTYSSQTYWSLSPSTFYATYTSSFAWYASAAGSLGDYYVTSTIGVRPVINLSSETLISGGIGTANDPFIVK